MFNGMIPVGVAIPHLFDDFLFDIPEEFGLTNVQVQILAGIFSVLLIRGFLVGAGKRSGVFSAGALGLTLALAGVLKQVPLMLLPEPYWGGLFEEILIVALIVSGLSLFFLSPKTWIADKDRASGDVHSV